jgi:hypothetical protein
MYYGANSKAVVAILGTGTGLTNGATATASIDRLGFDFASIDLIMGTANVVSNKPSTLKISESDDLTTYNDVTALVGGGVGGFTIPNADTSNPNVYRLNVDCRGRKRYLKLSVTPLTTQEVVMAARLLRAKEVPTTTTAAGVHVLANG